MYYINDIKFSFVKTELKKVLIEGEDWDTKNQLNQIIKWCEEELVSRD